MTLVVFSLPLDIASCCECIRHEHHKLGKKVEDIENLVMEMEIEVATKAELGVAHVELSNNFDTISKFRKDVTRFLVATEKLDKDKVDPSALPFCNDCGLCMHIKCIMRC